MQISHTRCTPPITARGRSSDVLNWRAMGMNAAEDASHPVQLDPRLIAEIADRISDAIVERVVEAIRAEGHSAGPRGDALAGREGGSRAARSRARMGVRARRRAGRVEDRQRAASPAPLPAGRSGTPAARHGRLRKRAEQARHTAAEASGLIPIHACMTERRVVPSNTPTEARMSAQKRKPARRYAAVRRPSARSSSGTASAIGSTPTACASAPTARAYWVPLGTEREGWNDVRAADRRDEIAALVRRGAWRPAEHVRTRSAREEPGLSRVLKRLAQPLPTDRQAAHRRASPSTSSAVTFCRSCTSTGSSEIDYAVLSRTSRKKLERNEEIVAAREAGVTLHDRRGQPRRPLGPRTINMTLDVISRDAERRGQARAPPGESRRRPRSFG